MMKRPVDCTCNGEHTQDAPGIHSDVLHQMYLMETCPAEKRALWRVATRPGRGLR
jgi:hypothetical protein